MAVSQNTHAAHHSSLFVISIIKQLFVVFFVLFIALLFSIIVEWVGIWRWWPEEGVMHSHDMVQAELQFLARASNSAPVENLMGEVFYLISWLDGVFEYTKLTSLLDSSIEIVQVGTHSAINITRVFSLRVAVLFFSMPTFIIFGLVGLTRGLVGRELRRWGAGRESSGMYHLYYNMMPQTLLGIWFVYLSMPFTINPFYIVGPAAIIFGFLVSNMAYRFKKYL